MGFLDRLMGRSAPTKTETRATSWDYMRGAGMDTAAGAPVSPVLAENISAVFGAVQAIAETVAGLPFRVLQVAPDGTRTEALQHPVAKLLTGDPNDWQTVVEWVETMQAHVLLRGNAFSEIRRDGRGQPVALIPLHPDYVAVLRIPQTGRVVYDVTDPLGGSTRRLLPEEVFHLKDRSDDGIIGKSRLQRARETFSTAMAVETFAASTYRNGAALSGIVTHPEQIGPEAAETLRKSLEAAYSGTGNAGKFAVLEEGMSWTALSVSPADAEMLASRRFSVEQVARMFRVPPPVLADLSNGSYSNVSELGRWFAQHTIGPWVRKWETALERALFSTTTRRSYAVEMDMDTLLRGDMLKRYQAYRIAREIGLANANELRRWEGLNPRTDPDADGYLSPMNMNPEQAGGPKDRDPQADDEGRPND